MNDSNQRSTYLENLKNKWEQKGFKCEIHTGSPGEGWSSKGHEAEEVFIPLEGEIEVSFQGKTFNPGIGEECIIPPNENHSFKSKTVSRYYWIAGYEFEEGVSGIQTS